MLLLGPLGPRGLIGYAAAGRGDFLSMLALRSAAQLLASMVSRLSVSTPRLDLAGTRPRLRTEFRALKQDILGISLLGGEEPCGASRGDTSG